MQPDQLCHASCPERYYPKQTFLRTHFPFDCLTRGSSNNAGSGTIDFTFSTQLQRDVTLLWVTFKAEKRLLTNVHQSVQYVHH